ncbi:MAG: hypothetical protein R3Y56_01645 [Akkermansia sp.]
MHAHLLIFATILVLIAIFAYLCVQYTGYYKRAIEINPLLLHKESLEEQISVAQATVSGLESKAQTMAEQLANAQSTLAEASIARNYLADNATTVDELKKVIDTNKAHLKDIKDTFNKRNDELTELNQQLGMGQASLDNIKEQLDTLNRDKLSLEQAQEDLKLHKKNLLNRIKELQKETEGEQERLLGIKREVDTANDLLAATQREQQAAAFDCQRIQSELATNKTIKQQLDAEILAAKEEESRIKSVQAAWKGTSKAQEELHKECWADLDRPYPFRHSINMLDKREDEWLDEFEGQLADAGIIFSQRMIHAFHTGMKAADYSPLLVLAGISGTGKSLLPELYAKSLGMNFLQVAVQPRWDSPQDMLGFYNYMESRFKATELSRLLWQSDFYNNPAHQQTNMAMNLVLLDEMNLARIEYYFSDMLSKLEVRRGINMQDEQQRRPAEIEIECGAQLGAKQSRRLFIGPNTLFVGTMNEDESTQSLSDKVMDRANVIRFNKPNELNAQPEKSKFTNFYEGLGSLDYNTWQSHWVQSNKDFLQRDKLLNILNETNQYLAQLGRPFAHRVSQSICAYVQNYPLGAASFEHALSDQLEMKVIPKLTGLELDHSEVKTSLNKLADLISREVDDEQLSQSFDKARQHSSGFFQWRGVQHP